MVPVHMCISALARAKRSSATGLVALAVAKADCGACGSRWRAIRRPWRLSLIRSFSQKRTLLGRHRGSEALRPEDLLSNGQGTLQQRLDLGVAVLVGVEPGQVAEADGHVRVLGAERLLPDRQGALVERLNGD